MAPIANVTSVRTKSDGTVVVVFDDSHRVVFVPNLGGWNNDQLACCEEIRLMNGDDVVVTFFSPRQHPLNKQGPEYQFGFQPAARSGYTLDVVTQYFVDAYGYVATQFGQGGKLVNAWRTVCRSNDDVQAIVAGEHPLR